MSVWTWRLQNAGDFWQSARDITGGGYNRVTVGFTCIADFRSFIGQEYIAGIVKACEDYDINFINMSESVKYSFFDDFDFLAHYEKKFRFMKAPLIDGLITWASSLAPYIPNEQIVKKFTALKPLPMVDIGYIDLPGIPALRIDNSCSVFLIIEHLVKVHGCRKIAFLGSEISRPHTERLQSFREAVRKFDIPDENAPVFMARSLDDADIVRSVDEIYSACMGNERAEKLDAIVTSSDIIAAALIRELGKRGISVPEDVAVTGFNNQYQGITSSPPITTINLEYFRRGYLAVKMLINQIMSPDAGKEIVKIPTSLIVRESCGCFETQIIEAGSSDAEIPHLPDDANEDEGRNYLLERVSAIFTREDYERKMDLVGAVFEDLFEDTSPPKTLQWFRQFLSGVRGVHFSSTDCQQKITDFRLALLELAGSNDRQRARVESITNQLRVLSSVISDYERIVQRNNSHLLNNTTQAAIRFAAATTGSEMKNALRTHLGELGIPGIILSLSDNMTTDLETSSVELVIPDLDGTEAERLPLRVSDESLFPKSFFPKNKRFSVVLEILHYSDRYFGFAFMQMQSRNMTLYDSVSLMICHSLHSLYLKEGRTKRHSMFMDTKPLEKFFSQGAERSATSPGRLTAQQITSYLIDHISEMTSLDKMAADLGVSKSKLVHEAKSVTGYSVQRLHEMLKMEMAKNMLREGRLKLAEIAERLGFQNGNYFSNVFKKNFGESPRNWMRDKSLSSDGAFEIK